MLLTILLFGLVVADSANGEQKARWLRLENVTKRGFEIKWKVERERRPIERCDEVKS